jgi:hypothetical protein
VVQIREAWSGICSPKTTIVPSRRFVECERGGRAALLSADEAERSGGRERSELKELNIRRSKFAEGGLRKADLRRRKNASKYASLHEEVNSKQDIRIRSMAEHANVT